ICLRTQLPEQAGFVSAWRGGLQRSLRRSVYQFDDAAEALQVLRRAGVESGHEVSNAQVAEAHDGRGDLLIAARDRVGAAPRVSWHEDVAAGRAYQGARVAANFGTSGINRGHLVDDGVGGAMP